MDSPQDVYVLVTLGATVGSVGLVVALVVVALRRPREAGAWWPAAAALV